MAKSIIISDGSLEGLVRGLNTINYKLNRKDYPKAELIQTCQSSLLKYLNSYSISSKIQDQLRKHYNLLWDILKNYDSFVSSYHIKRETIQRIRGELSNIVGEIRQINGIKKPTKKITQ